MGLWSFLTYYLQSDTHYSDTSVYPETSGNIDIDVGGLNGTSELIGSLTAVPRIDEVNDYQVVANHSSVSTCPFFGETTNKLVVWAYQAPVLLLLACNMVFLIYIMTVSITKYPHHHTKSFFSPFLFLRKKKSLHFHFRWKAVIHHSLFVVHFISTNNRLLWEWCYCNFPQTKAKEARNFF